MRRRTRSSLIILYNLMRVNADAGWQLFLQSRLPDSYNRWHTSDLSVFEGDFVATSQACKVYMYVIEYSFSHQQESWLARLRQEHIQKKSRRISRLISIYQIFLATLASHSAWLTDSVIKTWNTQL